MVDYVSSFDWLQIRWCLVLLHVLWQWLLLHNTSAQSWKQKFYKFIHRHMLDYWILMHTNSILLYMSEFHNITKHWHHYAWNMLQIISKGRFFSICLWISMRVVWFDDGVQTWLPWKQGRLLSGTLYWILCLP